MNEPEQARRLRQESELPSMTPTSTLPCTSTSATASLEERVAAYYRETTVDSYLVWAGNTLALHLGLSDGTPLGDRADFERELLAMNALLAERAAIGEGDRVLDAGCGVGGSSLWLAHERGATVVGVTLDAGQAELARRFASERGITGVRFERQDFTATTFAPASFDVVWNLESLCHIGDPTAYFAHALTLLDEGGRLVCADFFRGRGGPACEAMCAGWVLPALQSATEVADALRAAGFVDVELHTLTPRVVPTAQAMAQMSIQELLRLEIAAATGAPRRPTIEAHFKAAMGAAAGLADGSITYALVCATRPPSPTRRRAA